MYDCVKHFGRIIVLITVSHYKATHQRTFLLVFKPVMKTYVHLFLGSLQYIFWSLHLHRNYKLELPVVCPITGQVHHSNAASIFIWPIYYSHDLPRFAWLARYLDWTQLKATISSFYQSLEIHFKHRLPLKPRLNVNHSSVSHRNCSPSPAKKGENEKARKKKLTGKLQLLLKT